MADWDSWQEQRERDFMEATHKIRSKKAKKQTVDSQIRSIKNYFKSKQNERMLRKVPEV